MRDLMRCVLLLSCAIVPSLCAESLTPIARASTGDDDTISRGAFVYERYCANCHGADGNGQGRAAKLYDPKPANLQASRVNDAYRKLIIRRGGAHVGRSEFMPPWEQELTASETDDVIVFLGTIVK
jgi:mono/diheme cytochrome c family protein